MDDVPPEDKLPPPKGLEDELEPNKADPPPPPPMETAKRVKSWSNLPSFMGIKGSTMIHALPLDMRSIMSNGAEENQAHPRDFHGPRGKNCLPKTLFLVCSLIAVFTPTDRVP